MTDPALAWARRLAGDLELDPALPFRTPGESAAAAWARSGALWLTGPEQGPPVLPEAPLASCMDGALAVLRALAPQADLEHVDGACLLGERAAIAGLTRRGRTSPGGSCRLLPGKDGWLAVNLPRADDLRALPAWLAVGPQQTLEQAWPAVAGALAAMPVGEALQRARLLGLAVAGVPRSREPSPTWLQVVAKGPDAPPRADSPLVVDLSSLWAGPLCSDLLQRCGARVVKVESIRRPDGARMGPAAFFDLLNAGKACVAIDFAAREGRAALQRLIAAADVVVEASRPRALEQLGIDATSWVGGGRGRVWLSLTAHGRGNPQREWVGFGDDAAAAAGLPWRVAGGPLFVGDAIADPLAGVHGAVAVIAALRRGSSALLDVALARVAGVAASWTGWQDARIAHPELPVEAPRRPSARSPQGRARPLGADNGLLGGCDQRPAPALEPVRDV